jgi:hypothetical protein
MESWARATEPRQKFSGAGLAFRPRHTLHFQAERGVGGGGHPGEKIVFLAYQQYAGIIVVRSWDSLALAGVRREQAREHAQERGLAAAARSHEGEELSLTAVETQIPQSEHGTIGAWECNLQPRTTQTHQRELSFRKDVSRPTAISARLVATDNSRRADMEQAPPVRYLTTIELQ